ncbi:MAG: GTP-binding protein [Planctomycetes bacterium]|nr:GTP-binding protein [Planctomycetota bacterium]
MALHDPNDDHPAAPAHSQEDQPVAAAVSPPGVGGLAVVQVLGAGAVERACRFLRRRNGSQLDALPDDLLRLASWMDGTEHIDDVVVASSRRGGTESLLITTHGSVRVVERILICLQRAGVHIDRRLETSQIWDALSPTESSVMSHLPRAHTQRVAVWLTDQIVHLPATVEHIIGSLKCGQASNAIAGMQLLERTFPCSQLLLNGAAVVIVGPPNVGKSTLANRLFERPWSQESDQPGTTRDWVRQPLAINGIPLHLTDTAGLRQTDDPIEAQAIRQAHPLIRSADLQILVLDGSLADSRIHPQWMDQLLDPARLLVVLNKIDLGTRDSVLLDVSKTAQRTPLLLSALGGEGLGELRQAIASFLMPPNGDPPMSCIWDDGQLACVQRALALAPTDAPEAAKLLLHKFLGHHSKK